MSVIFEMPNNGGGQNLEFTNSGYSAPSSFGGSLSQGAPLSGGSFGEEPPLLEELGINFDHIKTKTVIALNPMGSVDPHLMDDSDLAGPLFFLCLLGMLLLLVGKVHFGYLYGLGVIAVLSMYFLLNVMSPEGISIDFSRVASVLGYCILPLVILSGLHVIVLILQQSLRNPVGYLIAAVAVAWSTWSSSKMFVAVCHMRDQRLLVAYPIALIYSTFALITLF